MAVVELALLMPLMFLLLSFSLEVGQFFRQYTVLQNATHSAARYLAAQPPYVIQNSTLGPNAAAVAAAMVRNAAAAANVQSLPVIINVQCDGLICGGSPALPLQVRVLFDFPVTNYFMGSIYLRFEATVPYAH